MESEPTTPDAYSTMSAYQESNIQFLRASAREWLEAVLEENLDKETSLEDLLADGTLLLRVSQHMKEDYKFPGHVEAASPGVTASPSYDRKSSLKYQPYASVETFLNLCKQVGLRDVDVFNPSDAVDKKDIRRVCVCLRRLSKKARTLHLSVPDFDNVKETLVTKMPREAVQKTKESLQHSATRSSRTGENGQVSSETSSFIADLRKDNYESETPQVENAEGELETAEPRDTESTSFVEADSKAETFNKEHHDVAAEHKEHHDVAADHKEPVVTEPKYSVKAAEQGIETIPLLSSHAHASQDHVDRNGSKTTAADANVEHKVVPKVPSAPEPTKAPKSSDYTYVPQVHSGRNGSKTSAAESKTVAEAPTAPKPTMSRIMLKPPSSTKPPVEEKPPAEAVVEGQKGLFRAHLQGTAPYATKEDPKKDDEDEGSPWLVPVLAGAAAIAGGILGLVLWKKGDNQGPMAGIIRSGKSNLRKLKGREDSDSSSDSESDDEAPRQRSHSGGLYEVKDGDNLSSIAKRSGRKNWQEIANKNPSIRNPDLIYPGDQLKL